MLGPKVRPIPAQCAALGTGAHNAPEGQRSDLSDLAIDHRVTSDHEAMCYSIYFSTTSEEDLTKLESDQFLIWPLEKAHDAAAAELLTHPSRWYIASRYGGCSCYYRHDAGGMGYGPVVDWYPEDEDDIEATRHVYDFLAHILDQGHQLDLLELWADTPLEDVQREDVNLSQIPRDHFRFRDGYLLQLAP